MSSMYWKGWVCVSIVRLTVDSVYTSMGLLYVEDHLSHQRVRVVVKGVWYRWLRKDVDFVRGGLEEIRV